MCRTRRTECNKCGASDYGLWTSSSTGRAHRYCRPCRRVRARTYSGLRIRNGGSHTHTQWLRKLAEYDGCPDCGRRWSEIPQRPDRRYRYVWTKDHIVPLNKGGSDSIDNIRPLCYRCNSSKCDGRQTLGT